MNVSDNYLITLFSTLEEKELWSIHIKCSIIFSELTLNIFQSRRLKKKSLWHFINSESGANHQHGVKSSKSHGGKQFWFHFPDYVKLHD